MNVNRRLTCTRMTDAELASLDEPEAIVERMLRSRRRSCQTYVRIDPDIPMISLFRALASEGLAFRYRGGELVIEQGTKR